MVVTIGYGEDNDLHPLDKRHVAQRLATAAESLVYGRDRAPMGPLPVMAIHKDDGIEISFIHTGGGLVCTGDVPFDILEPGGSIYRVKACRYDCHGGHLIKVPISQEIRLNRGTLIRYAWDLSPELFLYNDQGLPATPFELRKVRSTTRDHTHLLQRTASI